MATKKQKTTTLKPITGAECAKLRTKLNLTQAVFWKRVHATQSAGSRYENGRPITVQTGILVQMVYGTPEKAAEILAALRG